MNTLEFLKQQANLLSVAVVNGYEVTVRKGKEILHTYNDSTGNWDFKGAIVKSSKVENWLNFEMNGYEFDIFVHNTYDDGILHAELYYLHNNDLTDEGLEIPLIIANN